VNAWREADVSFYDGRQRMGEYRQLCKGSMWVFKCMSKQGQNVLVEETEHSRMDVRFIAVGGEGVSVDVGAVVVAGAVVKRDSEGDARERSRGGKIAYGETKAIVLAESQ
jgi:hypothetical protein